MISRLRLAAAPLYLFLCIVMGGSAQGIFSNLALQLIGIAILLWALLARVPVKDSRPARLIGWLGALAVALVVVQLIPLPPALWSQLPGRQFVVDGFSLLGQPLPWRPLSLAPADTIATAMALIPPLAMLALILRLGAYRDSWLVIALLLAAFISVGLGVLQIQSGGTDYYLYPYANLGTASGLFANANFMGTLLLVTIPFLVAVAGRRWRKAPKPSDRMLTFALAGGAAAVLLLGASTNQSFALLIIGAPVLGASALLLIPAGRVRIGRLAAMVGLLLAAGLGTLAFLMASGMGPSNRTSVTIREDIWAHSRDLVADHALVGSGIGTYRALYPQVEDSATIERTHINHAHNDYLEIAIEAGVPGMLLMLAFLAWWAWRAVAIWRSPNDAEIARAACIASAAILLHSLVDFPLRTAAIATCLAMALALMADPPRRRHQARAAELRPTRHLEL